MSSRFCPECGAQCRSHDQNCQECQFPLTIQVMNFSTYVRMDRAVWKRLSRWLHGSGLRVVTEQPSEWGSHQAWWALPGFGLLIFIGTLFFGGEWADLIWKPAAPPAQVLDLNRTSGEAASGPRLESKKGVEGDVSFLKDAFKVSQDQELLGQDLDTDLESYLHQPKASLEQVSAYLERAFLEVRVQNLKRKGVLVTDQGHFLVDSATVRNAFRNESQMLSSNGSFVQKTVFVVPEVGAAGESKVPSQMEVDGGGIGLTLLKADLIQTPNYGIEFDKDLDLGDVVWLTTFVSGRFYPEKTKIYSTLDLGNGISVWLVELENDPTLSGSPVFNEFGKLSGVLIHHFGQLAVVSLRRLRERAPLIFKEIK